ncbi:MAG: molybdate ABC transporter substrate-binding protein [Betaproteobacteria bacterium]|nr:molybdate ABC transporter substrate-binding protein [Betaproteobacteria bacterium]
MASFSLAQTAPAVAAAADLKFALPELAQAFETGSGRKLRLSYGSSGMFAQQIAQGAPFELFFSADESYVAMLQQAGRTMDGGKLYALGRIALFIPNGSPIQADNNLRDLAAAARDGRLKRLAMANPEHAPYGRAAREVLQRNGLWDLVSDKLALGENAAQAAQFATSGSAQAGLIPLTLARAPELAAKGAFVTLPESWHLPLKQRMVLIQGGGETARLFYAFVQTPAAQAILMRHGFAQP